MISAPVVRSPNPRGSGEQLRGELVAAARELLLAPREVAPFSLRAVAKTVGVSPTAVYRHFASAGSLVEAVLEDQNDALRGALERAESSDLDRATSIVSAVADLALRYVRWGLANPGGYQLLFESADRIGHRGGPGTAGWDMIESLSLMIERMTGADTEVAMALAIRAWSSLHGLTSLRLHKPGLAWPTTVEQEVEALARALFSPAPP